MSTDTSFLATILTMRGLDVSVSAVIIRRKLGVDQTDGAGGVRTEKDNGKQSKNTESTAKAEIFEPIRKPMPTLRTTKSRLSQVRYLPNLLPKPC